LLDASVCRRAVSEELEVLKTVARRLDEARIGYMLTGSIALNYYALPRMTRDIGVVVELGPDAAARLIQLFETDFYVDPDAVRRAIATCGMFNVIHDRFVVKVDFVVRKDSEYRREEFARRRRVEVEGQPLWILLLRRSGEERLRMGCSMHATAQALVPGLGAGPRRWGVPGSAAPGPVLAVLRGRLRRRLASRDPRAAGPGCPAATKE
jgi:hypothetical protein